MRLLIDADFGSRLMDLSGNESRKKSYGMDSDFKNTRLLVCLLARRLVERGVVLNDLSRRKRRSVGSARRLSGWSWKKLKSVDNL